jgi:hypothetical protein
MVVAKIMKLAVVPALLAASSVIGATPAQVAHPRCPAWDGVQPQGSNGGRLTGVAVLPSCTAWAVGASPIQQIDGPSWAPQASSPDARDLLAVAATSASNAWAVGSPGHATVHALIEHWNGTSWTSQQAAQPGATLHLSGVAASSAADAWAVGYYATKSGRRTLIEHWDGTNWTWVPSPSPGGKDNNSELTGVAVVSPSRAWAVGFYQTPGSGQRTLILRWNGKSWQRVPSPDPAHRSVLTSVAATTVHAWAVGYAMTGKTGGDGIQLTQTVLLQWNGTSWTQIPSPNLIPFGGNRLFGVAATSDSNIWAVGTDQRPGDNIDGLILHWDGVEWQAPTVPLSNFSGPELLASVAATNEDNVWAVGWAIPSGDQSSPLILHFDGQSWSS